MDLRQLTTWGKTTLPEAKEPGIPIEEKCLTVLLEGAALNTPEIDAKIHREFRQNASRLALQIPENLPDDEKLVLIRTIVHEFENFRVRTEHFHRDQMAGWRSLVGKLIREWLASMEIKSTAPNVDVMLQKISHLTSGEEIQAFSEFVDATLAPLKPKEREDPDAHLTATDHSTANDNVAGLLGGGSAVEHVRRVLERGGKGHIVLFQLSCLTVISQRFGPEAVQDCVMAVSAFLTHSLHSEDSIYHWSDSALLAVLQGRASEQILAAELQRLVMQNRDTTVEIGGRNIMVRIPISFDMAPIERLRTAEDMFKLTWLKPIKR